MTATAFILTDGLLDKTESKTAHGLILGSSRYHILGVIDEKNAGKDAGNVITGQNKNIPVFAFLQQAINALGQKPDYCVVGVAPSGGKLSDTLLRTITEAIRTGIHIVSGLHTFLNDHPVIAPLAKENQVKLIDVRKPKAASDLTAWSGKIASVTTPRIAVIGTDCAIGKRTTAGLLLDLCRKHDINAEMIYTGQTGWLQGIKYGFILDSTLNDFVSGEVEKSILTCVAEAAPALIFLEGQSSLRNPAGPCGAELIISAGAKYVILQHSPAREHFICDPGQQYKIPDVEDEIALIKYYGAEVIAVSLNSQGFKQAELQQLKNQFEEKLKIPVLCPRESGVADLLPVLKNIIQKDG